MQIFFSENRITDFNTAALIGAWLPEAGCHQQAHQAYFNLLVTTPTKAHIGKTPTKYSF